MSEALALGSLLVAALGGSFHCVGMCGGFVWAATGRDQSRTRALVRQGLYHVGRTLTYVFLGALCGLGSSWLVYEDAVLRRCVVGLCGVVLLVVGAHESGIFQLSSATGPVLRVWGKVWQQLHGVLASLPPMLRPLLIGAVNGFLPCPLVFAFLAAATATSSVIAAMSVMAMLGLGTIPALFSVTLLGKILPGSQRRLIVRTTGAALLVCAVYFWYMALTGSCCDSGSIF